MCGYGSGVLIVLLSLHLYLFMYLCMYIYVSFCVFVCILQGNYGVLYFLFGDLMLACGLAMFLKKPTPVGVCW
jgi:hypothetical protein